MQLATSLKMPQIYIMPLRIRPGGPLDGPEGLQMARRAFGWSEGLRTARRAFGWPGGPTSIFLPIGHKPCSVILLKAPNQAEGLVRRFRGSQEIPGVTLQNLWII